MSDRLTSWPDPRFRFGQVVVREFCCEQTQEVFVDQGFVMGMVYNRPGRRPGWWYVIQWTSLPSSDWLDLPYFEEAHESELKTSRSVWQL